MLGRTRDDAAGEAFDKVQAAWPRLSAARSSTSARQGNDRAIPFPATDDARPIGMRPRATGAGLRRPPRTAADFSSGLKTAWCVVRCPGGERRRKNRSFASTSHLSPRTAPPDVATSRRVSACVVGAARRRLKRRMAGGAHHRDRGGVSAKPIADARRGARKAGLGFLPRCRSRRIMRRLLAPPCCVACRRRDRPRDLNRDGGCTMKVFTDYSGSITIAAEFSASRRSSAIVTKTHPGLMALVSPCTSRRAST